MYVSTNGKSLFGATADGCGIWVMIYRHGCQITRDKLGVICRTKCLAVSISPGKRKSMYFDAPFYLQDYHFVYTCKEHVINSMKHRSADNYLPSASWIRKFLSKTCFCFLNAAIIPILSAFTVKGHHLLNVVFKRTPGSAESAFLIKA